VDGGLHATEVLGAQQLIETVWQMVSRDDAETKRSLSDVILLCCLVNPDGMELTRQQSRITSLRKRFVSASSRLTICQTVSISCCAPRTSVACNPPSTQTTALPSAASARACSSVSPSASASRREISL